MAVIFFLSGQEDLSSGLGTVDLIGRKFIHAAEYALLWFLWWRALGFDTPWPAAAIALLYAISDEWHQTFTSGRHGSPVDVAIDMAGVTLAVWWFTRRQAAPRHP